MGLFDKFAINRAIATVVSMTSTAEERAAAVSRLREIGSQAVPKMIEALPDDQSNALGQILAELLTNAMLPVVVSDGLLSENVERVSRIKRVLLAANKIDPNRLFELYIGKGGAIINIADYLTHRREAINAKSMMRVLEFAREDSHPAIFTLVDNIARLSLVSSLIEFLKSAEWEGRLNIAKTIARFPVEPVRDALVRLLADPHKAVRQAALDGIAGLGMPVPVAPLCALLRDPDMQVQAKAIDALVKLNDSSSVQFLLEILQNESEQVRRAAVEVLNAVGNANAIKDLLHALKDQDWWVRVRAADALGSIGGPKVIDAVLQILSDDDEFMRRTAVEILNTTKDERAFAHLVKALADPDWWVRERAIDALANLGNKAAVPHLIALLEEDNQATPIAIRALAQIGDSQAVPAIMAKLSATDDVIQREAVEALGSLVSSTQLPEVQNSLREFTPVNEDIQETARRISTELASRTGRGGLKQGPARSASTRPGDLVSESRNDRAAPPSSRTDAPPARAAAVVPPVDPNASKPVVGTAPQSAPVPANAIKVSSDVATIAPNQILSGRYKVIREIGKGCFGTVLQVADQMVGEEIALKIINPSMISDESTIERFMHEVRYARRITHENVIRVHDFLMVDGYYAISMEYFESYPLSRRIRARLHLDLDRGLKFVRDIASGISVAHQADIMHRDLKPANILVNDNNALKIVDFGLAAASSNSNSRVTKTGHLVGTPTYMSPEQARGLSIDSRTDIYSLGVLMYEIFTGVVPYAGDSPMAVLYQHLEGTKVPPRNRNPIISPALEAIILKAMAVDPDARYQSAIELLGAIDALDEKAAA